MCSARIQHALTRLLVQSMAASCSTMRALPRLPHLPQPLSLRLELRVVLSTCCLCCRARLIGCLVCRRRQLSAVARNQALHLNLQALGSRDHGIVATAAATVTHH